MPTRKLLNENKSKNELKSITVQQQCDNTNKTAKLCQTFTRSIPVVKHVYNSSKWLSSSKTQVQVETRDQVRLFS
jgi:hypothetical protein